MPHVEFCLTKLNSNLSDRISRAVNPISLREYIHTASEDLREMYLDNDLEIF